MPEITNMSFDAQLLMHSLVSRPDQPTHMLVLQLAPRAIVDLITESTERGDSHWPEAVDAILSHFTDDAIKRTEVALKELLGHGYIDRIPQER